MAPARSNERHHEVKPEAESGPQSSEEADTDEDEFKITVKKLETVVRPRGVLAD